jgi:autotransporter-associated beta strand protein
MTIQRIRSGIASSRAIRILALGLALFALVASSRAATTTWLGNTSTNWNTAANWSAASVPATNDSLVFTNAGTAGASLHNDIPAGRVFNGITFAANATNAFTLSGNAFGLNGTVANSSTNIHTINNAIILAANAIISPTSTNLILAGAISDGGSNFSVTLNGGKTVVLSATNTFGGTLAINSGVTLSIGAANNLGAGTNITFGASSLSIISASASVLIPASTTITVGSGCTAAFVTPTAGTVLEVAAKLTGVGAAKRNSSSYTLGTVRFSNDASDYTGDFSMGYGNTEFTSVANQGTASSLGKGATGTGGQITLGNSSSGASFRYVGAANTSTTRPLNWTATTGALALDASGAGTVAFLTNTALRSGSGNIILTLQGSSPGTNRLAQTINDGAASGITTLTKSGLGRWLLNGTNTFSGGVNLNSGWLQVNAVETPGTSGPLGKSGTISFGGGALQYSPANTFDYSSRFSTNVNQSYSVDLAGQTVTWAAPLTSTNGTLTVDSSIASGKLILTGTNTYTGNTTVLGGVLSVSSDGKLGSATTGDIVLDGGTLTAATNFTLSSSRTVLLGPDSDGGGTLDVPAGVTLTFGGTIADKGASPGSLTKTGSGMLTLSSSSWSTYTGDTSISSGTVAISGYGMIGATGNLTIAPGATLDVSSATGGYALGAGQTLVAGNGTSFVKGKLSLGSAALALFWTNGVPSLTISGNKLVMNNNATTVTVAGTTPLPVGVYKIISKGSGGSVSGVVSNSLVNVAGAGATAGASLQITSGELYLNVHGSNPTTTALASAAATQTYGDATTFTATVSPANATGIVTFSDGTTTYGTAALAGGQATLTLAGGVLSAGVYPMNASYSGNSTYGPSISGVLTQTINQAVLAVAANNVSRWLGNANPLLTASYVGLIAGDTTDVLAGAPTLATTATPASPLGSYPITVALGSLTNVTGNYALVFTNGTLSVIARSMPYPQGSAFPLMMYEVNDGPSAVNVAAYGWNIIQKYGMSTNSYINSFLQLAYDNSVGGDVPIPCGGDVSTNFVEWPQSQVRAWIQGSAASNNIAWWDMPEEMRSWKPTEVQLLKDYRAWVQLYDTNSPRPTFEYTPNARTLTNQLGVVSNVDIVGVSCYCEFASQPHAWVRYKVAEAGVHAVALAGATLGSNYLAGQKTVVGVLYLADPGTGQLPAPEQSYHDVWSAIASGAQGISVWAYWHGLNDNPALTNNLNQFNLAASQISGSEIGQVVLFGARYPNVSFAVTAGPTNTESFQPGDGYTWQYPSLNVLCATWSSNVYVIAVNSTSDSLAAVITNLPATTGSASLPFELRSLPVSGNGFADTFRPWGVHVYKLAAASASQPVISSIALAGESVTMSCTGTPGISYVLQCSTNLSSLPNWLNLNTNTASGSGSFSFTNGTSAGLGFYRLRQQ